jgi:hypothetical protein
LFICAGEFMTVDCLIDEPTNISLYPSQYSGDLFRHSFAQNFADSNNSST